jgi:hypothetical protein
LREFDFDAADFRTAADGGAIEPRRDARAGGNFEVGIFTGAEDFAELGLKLAARKIENEWCSGSFCFAKKNFRKI